MLAVGMLLFSIVLIVGAALFFYGQSIEINSTKTVMVNQPYQVHFSKALEKSSIENEDIYVTDNDGNRVNASIGLNKDQQSLVIEGLKTGQYLLHVEERAFGKKSFRAEKKSVEFNVVDEISEITSVQDIQNYFEMILNQEKNRRDFTTTTMEEKSDSAEGGSSYSSTNNQVEGIEEGDTVITDGQFIYSILDNQIIITDTTKPELKVASKISLDSNSYPTQLMMHHNMLIVIIDQYIEQKKDGYVSGISMTKAAFYNMEDATNPKLIREIGQDGYMNGIRKYDNTLYIVTNKTPNYWLLSEENDIELRPYTYDSEQDEELKPMEIDKLMILPGSNEPNYTIISAIDLEDYQNEKVETKGFLGGSSALYMSKDALYLTAVNYLPMTFEGDDSSKIAVDKILPIQATDTNIFKFSIDGTDVNYKATTSLKGTILNQFSMDEHQGYFRVAVTEGSTFGNDKEASKNHLFIYDEELEKVGEVKDLAKGEKIYSARFMGDKAYIVTFKQVDPLFVIDLQNLEQPKVLGELKIPGFSNYLHPLDDNHLIGIGYDTENRVDSGTKQAFTTTTGIKMSLFDITDYENPIEQDTVVIGGRGTYSEVEYNHKALFRNEKYNYYGFPVIVYEGKGEYEVQYKGSGAVVYEVTAENGIDLKGNLITLAQEGEEYEDWESIISRLLYINNTLYSVSRSEVKSYDLKTFKELSSVKLK